MTSRSTLLPQNFPRHFGGHPHLHEVPDGPEGTLEGGRQVLLRDAEGELELVAALGQPLTRPRAHVAQQVPGEPGIKDKFVVGREIVSRPVRSLIIQKYRSKK